MKHLILILLLSCIVKVNAQSEKFNSAMKVALEQIKNAKTAEQNIEVEAKLERIAAAEKTEWLPYYYAAMIKARMSMQKQGGDPDKTADEAAELIAKADSLNTNNSEIYCIKSMVASAKMLVDPQNRWMQYGQESQMMIEKAKKMDASNPRPFALQAISLKNMPEQFGGGCGNAKPIAEKAKKLFEEFKPKMEVHPNWGKEMVDGILEDCK